MGERSHREGEEKDIETHLGRSELLRKAGDSRGLNIYLLVPNDLATFWTFELGLLF
jgi:hypothetical protein